MGIKRHRKGNHIFAVFSVAQMYWLKIQLEYDTNAHFVFALYFSFSSVPFVCSFCFCKYIIYRKKKREREKKNFRINEIQHKPFAHDDDRNDDDQIKKNNRMNEASTQQRRKEIIIAYTKHVYSIFV